MNNIIRCLPHATKLLQVQHCFLCIEEENDWLFWSLQLMRDYGRRNFARAQNNKNLAQTESCWPRVCPKVARIWGIFFLNLPYFRQIASRSLPKYSRILELLHTFFVSCNQIWLIPLAVDCQVQLHHKIGGGTKTPLIVRKGKWSEYDEKLNFQAIRTCTLKLSLRVRKQTTSQKLISVYISDTKFRGL